MADSSKAWCIKRAYDNRNKTEWTLAELNDHIKSGCSLSKNQKQYLINKKLASNVNLMSISNPNMFGSRAKNREYREDDHKSAPSLNLPTFSQNNLLDDINRELDMKRGAGITLKKVPKHKSARKRLSAFKNLSKRKNASKKVLKHQSSKRKSVHKSVKRKNASKNVSKRKSAFKKLSKRKNASKKVSKRSSAFKKLSKRKNAFKKVSKRKSVRKSAKRKNAFKKVSKRKSVRKSAKRISARKSRLEPPKKLSQRRRAKRPQ